MRKKLTYVLLISLLVGGSSAFAMMGEEGVLGHDFNMSKSTALRLLNTKNTLEVNSHHYKVRGTVSGKAGESFTEAPDRMLTFSNLWLEKPNKTVWYYQIDPEDKDATLYIEQKD